MLRCDGWRCPDLSETQLGMGSGCYQAVPLESVNVIELDEWEMEFVADPAMGWEGEPLLFFNAGEPLPQTPVMAPEIFIQPDGGE
jgi:hypothetical protein